MKPTNLKTNQYPLKNEKLQDNQYAGTPLPEIKW